MKQKLIYVSIILLNLLIFPSFAQSRFVDAKKQIGFNTFFSTSNQNPFWIRSNQYGTVPLKSQILQIGGSYKIDYDSTRSDEQYLKLKKKLDFGFGTQVVGNLGRINQLLITEIYTKFRLKGIELYAGRRREIAGLVDSSLTSGSYIWSGNALPVPKIQLHTPNFIKLNELIAAKVGFSHGWLGNSNTIKNIKLHQKFIYGRLGKESWKIRFYAGINHQVQWGGYFVKPYIETQTGKLIESLGNDLRTYLEVVSGIALNKDGQGLDLDGVPINDAWNRRGNHLGTIDIMSEFNLSKHKVFLYRQSIYEDGSLFYLNNIVDGLLGISIQRKDIDKGLIKFAFEYINTTNQGGNTGSSNTIPELRGRDNYFNNTFYQWIYRENTIGTPFILPLYTIQNNTSSLNIYPLNYLANNRVKGICTTFDYTIRKATLRTIMSYTQNLGFYGFNIDLKQTSILQSIHFSWDKYLIHTKLGYDTNGIIKHSLGLNFGMTRSF